MTEQAQEQATPTAATETTQETQPYFVAQTKEDYERVYGPTRQEGRSSYEKWLLEQTGAEKADEVIAAYKDAQEVARQLEGEEIQRIRSEYEEKLGGASSKAEKYEGALKTLLAKEREGLPEHILTLLNDRDPADQLSWIAENREAIAESQKPPSVGRGSSPGVIDKAVSVATMSDAEFEALQRRVEAGETVAF
jgi:hypothetical protein